MADLTPLEKVEGLDEALRQKLSSLYWITSAEELVSTARSSNAQYGSGLKALAVALGIDDARTMQIVQAAMAIAPGAASFSVDTEMDVGDGLIIEGLAEVDASSFGPPPELPEAVEPLAKLPPPRYQGKRNSCVAFSLAAIYQTLSNDETDLSEQFLYWACKDRDKIPGDVGTNPAVGMKVLQEVGVCTEATWPYKPEPVDMANPGHARPPEPAFVEAKRRRIKAFQQLPAKEFRQIKAAIAAGKPVLIGLYIWEFWTNSGQARRLGKLRAPLPGERRGGGHAMCAVGYRDDAGVPGGGYFIVRNSWGPEWANENPDGPGYCHVPYRLVFEQGLAAFAAEGVEPVAEEKPAVSLGGSAEELSLEALIARAKSIEGQLKELVELMVQLSGGATKAAPAATAPAAAAPAAAAPAKTKALGSGFSGPLIMVSSGEKGAGEELYPNGIDGTTGQPLLRIDAATASHLAQGKGGGEPKEMQNLYKAKKTAASGAHFGTVAGVGQSNIAEARWAVVVNALESAEIIKALAPLISFRAGQQGVKKLDLSVKPGETCGAWYNRNVPDPKAPWESRPPVLLYRPGDRVNAWLARHGVSQGPVDPKRGVPYYLMLAGRPGPLEEGDETFIPLNFQYELDIFWGVGRLIFTDAGGQHRWDAYTKYAERIVAVEQKEAETAKKLSREIAYFGTKHDLDTSTIRSADELVTPLVSWHKDAGSLPAKFKYGHQLFMEKDATRSNLEKLLKGGKPPAVLFTASHGLGLPVNHKDIVMHQGALVTQDWTGFGSIKREHWYAGEDLGDKAGLDGMFALLFACYGAGCPQQDEFIFDEAKGRPQIAPFPFIAQFPQQLLLNGALAVLGHVERAWTYSFSSAEGAKAQIQPFMDVLGRLLEGKRAGDATDQFNVIQGARAMTLTEELEEIKFGKVPDPTELSAMWMARNDARNYALLGDPAVRLPFQA